MQFKEKQTESVKTPREECMWWAKKWQQQKPHKDNRKQKS